MPQPPPDRDGYGIFVRCCDLGPSTSTGEFVAMFEALDAILLQQVSGKRADFFPNPYGGAVYRPVVEAALVAAHAVITGLGAQTVAAAIGIAWGRIQRTVNVHAWNAAALSLNEGARLAFCDAAAGRVLVTPHVMSMAGAKAEFSEERKCFVKGKEYHYHAVESADYKQRLAAPLARKSPRTFERSIVLWDIKGYSSEEPDGQAHLSNDLALAANGLLTLFGDQKRDYGPAGDGGFAVFDSGLQALEFAKAIQKDAAGDTTIGTGITLAEVAFIKRGPVGPGVLRADAISAKAPSNGIAILAEVWRNIEKATRDAWRTEEIAPRILSLEPVSARSSNVEPVQTASAGPSGLQVTVPPLPPNYIERPQALAGLRSALLSPDANSAITLVAVHGMAGIGKTVLAQALFHDDEVLPAFPDGRVWITVGREPRYDLDTTLREIVTLIGGAVDEKVLVATAYKTAIHNKAALIVLDDIWNKAHLDPFLAASPRSRFLFTTRDASIARFAGAREHSIDVLDDVQSRELLVHWAGLQVAELPPAADGILRECGGLPLALSTIGGLLRRVDRAVGRYGRASS